MQLSGGSRRRLVPSVLCAVMLAGCGDGLSPRDDLVARFDALAAKGATSNQPRYVTLKIAAHTLRRGAPINTMYVEVDGTAREFQAVAIEWGFSGSNLFTSVIAWRGPNANQLLHLSMIADTLAYPDTDTSEDTAVYIGNDPEQVRLINDTTELWTDVAGNGHVDTLATLATCTPLSTPFSCQRIRLGVDFDLETAQLYADEPLPAGTLKLRRTALNAIRYVKSCPVSGGSSTSCSISLVSEDY